MFETKKILDFNEKIKQLRLVISQKGFSGLWISSVVNFAWLTGGRAFVNIADESASGRILITQNDVYLVATNNEVPRLIDEELYGFNLKIIEYPWYTAFKDEFLKFEKINNPLISDKELEPEISILRKRLSNREVELTKLLGKKSAEIVESCCKNVNVGDKECEIAGRLSNAFWAAGMEPLVLNIAADERAFKYRHPIPTDNKLKEHLAISICSKKWGLNVTLTRVVHFGSLSDDLRKKHDAAVKIDAFAISESIPGVRVNTIFSKILEMYKEVGFSSEWKMHPIGGLIGYKPREYNAAEESDDLLEINQAFSWNPTIAGTKSEDTIVINEKGNEIITHTDNYPFIEVKVKGKIIKRPDILVR